MLFVFYALYKYCWQTNFQVDESKSELIIIAEFVIDTYPALKLFDQCTRLLLFLAQVDIIGSCWDLQWKCIEEDKNKPLRLVAVTQLHVFVHFVSDSYDVNELDDPKLFLKNDGSNRVRKLVLRDK